MHARTAFLVAKQCLVYEAALAKEANVICFGSAALDLYIDPKMRFGETGEHQDIDLLFVPHVWTGDGSDALEAFVERVFDRVQSAFPLLPRHCLKSFINMTSIGMYCAHLSVKGRLFADVTQLSPDVDALVSARFPRKESVLHLPDPLHTPELSIRVASLEELLHRLVCISESEPAVDGLPVVSAQYNVPAIRKSRLRLCRLRELHRLSMVATTPCGWYGGEEDMIPAPSQCVTSEQTYVQEILNLQKTWEGMFATFSNACMGKLASLQGLLVSANEHGKKLAAEMTARYKHNMHSAKTAVLASLGVLADVKTDMFIAIHLRDMTGMDKTLQMAVKKKMSASTKSLDAHFESLRLMERDLVCYTTAFEVEEQMVFEWKGTVAKLSKKKKKKKH